MLRIYDIISLMKQKKLFACARQGPGTSNESKNFIRKRYIRTQGLSASIRIVSSACADNLETREKEGKLWQRFRSRNLWNTRGYSNVHTRAASNQGRAWSRGHRSLRSFTFAFRILRATAVTIFPVNRPVRFRVISMDYLNHSERRWLANTSLIRMSDRCQRNTRME